jgi:hypothetical protein
MTSSILIIMTAASAADWIAWVLTLSGSTTPNFSMSTGQTITKPTVTVPSTITGGTSTGSTAIGGGIASAAAAAAVATNNVVSGSFNPGRFREAEAASMGTTINLTVTGAFDKEGTARTIVDTLNNSFYRGTGGATNLQIA